MTSTWHTTFTTTQNIQLNLSHLNNSTKILSLIFKVLWTIRLRCVLAILVILDYSLIFRMIIPEVILIKLSSWGWAQSCSKHVEDSNKHIIEKTVRQVGYLPELSSRQIGALNSDLSIYGTEQLSVILTVSSGIWLVLGSSVWLYVMSLEGNRPWPANASRHV
jgi:hypothetical protein